MKPMLSIIIPCYNGEKFLADAVSSVLKQPCQDLEIIIVDDGSKDSSGVIADQFALEHENIQVIHIPNSGVSVARNKGIEQALGNYIGFLDADDVLCRNAYDSETHSVLKSGQFDMLSFSYMKGTEDMRYGCMISAGAPGVYLREDKDYIRQTEDLFCSYLFRRDLLVDSVGFPEGIRYCEDACFLFLAARRARNMMQYEKPWFVYRMNFSSTMHRLKNADYILEEVDAWNWCIQNSTDQKDISDCKGNIYSYMAEYIRFSCMYGVAVSEIQKNVLDNQSFRMAMNDYGTFWVSEHTEQLHSDFQKAPQKVWAKYRMRGIAYTAAKRLIRTKPGNVINQKIRYRLALKDFLVE